MRRRFSSRFSGSTLKKYCSLNDPRAPPSADAPLSDMRSTIVSSSSPSSSRKSRTRPHLRVGVGHEPGEHLHHPGVEALLVGGQRVPGRDPVRPLAQLGALGQEARGQLALEHLLAPLVPALVEPAAVGLDERVGRLVRRMAGAGREPEEERLVGRRGPQVLDVLDGPIGEVLGEVVAVLGGRRRLDRVVVVDEIRVVLVGLAAHEAVVPLEPTAQRPLVPRAAERHLGGRREVPLADGVGGVAVADEDLGQEPVLGRHRRRCSRGSPTPARRCAPCRCCGGCARTAGRHGWASRARSCGSSSTADRRRRGGRTSAWRCPSRSNRSARSRRRRAGR